MSVLVTVFRLLSNDDGALLKKNSKKTAEGKKQHSSVKKKCANSEEKLTHIHTNQSIHSIKLYTL